VKGCNVSVKELKQQIAACAICSEHLPHDPRPVTSWQPGSRILIIGQAPGRAVHASGVPWQDASGHLLRSWLSVSDEQFYDPEIFALMPMGFCFPGKGKSGDMAPRPECAPQWHALILEQLKKIELTILIGTYSQKYYLKETGRSNLTENVRAFREFLPKVLPLPHPSPRNRPWISANPWFENELLPELRQRVRKIIA
jgi:uracil-DNA glycosylase